MSKFKVTGPIARAELARRKNNKKSDTYEPPANDALKGVTNAELRAASAASPEKVTGVKSAAKVSAKSATDAAASALRKQAWAMREAGEGTYRECLAAIGGTPARG